MKKASFLATLILLMAVGFSQFLSATTTNIGKCDDLITAGSLYECPDDNCYYSSTTFTCTSFNGRELPILYRNPDCDYYYCLEQLDP